MMLFKLGLRNLARNPRRSAVMILTVALGVGALFLYDGFNTGIMEAYRENTIHFKYGHGQLNRRGYREIVADKPWRYWLDDSPQLLAAIRSLPGVTHVFPRVDFYSVVTNGTVNIGAKGTGIDGREEADFFRSGSIVAGEVLSDQTDGILIGSGLAKSLNAGIKSRLTLFTNTVYDSYNGVDVTVTGIFTSGIKDLDDGYFRIQRKLANRLLENEKVETIAIGLSDEMPWDTFAGAVQARFPDLEATSFEVLDKALYQNAVDYLQKQFNQVQFIILLIVTLGITNTISFTVLERTREIGNLRANGESGLQVLDALLIESVIAGVVGGALGLLAMHVLNAALFSRGIVMPVAPGLTIPLLIKIALRPGYALITFGMGVVVTILATLFAGWRQVNRPIARLISNH